MCKYITVKLYITYTYTVYDNSKQSLISKKQVKLKQCKNMFS